MQTLQTFHLQGIVEQKTLEGHSDWVRFLVKINGNTIASASLDKTIKIWDIINGNCLKTLEGHSRGVNFLVKINGNTIASASGDITIIWDIITGNCLKTLKGHSDYIPCFYCFIQTSTCNCVSIYFN